MADVTIQPSSKDNYMWEKSPDSNYGTLVYIATRCHLTGQSYRALVEFPVNWGTDVPEGAIITDAKLRLYYYNYYVYTGYADPVGRTILAYRLLRLDWHETQSTPTIYKTGANWTALMANSDGNDHTTVDGASAVIPASFDWMEWDVTEQVKVAQAGTMNVAYLLRDSIEVGTTYYLPYWYSREEAVETNKRPALVITYETILQPTVTTQDVTDIEQE